MANPIANVPGSSQRAGNKDPQHVMLVDTAGDYVAGTGGGAATIADGADVTQGALADAKVTGDNSGTLSAKLRGLSYLLNLVTDIANTRLNVFIQNTSLALAAGSALIGKTVGNIDHDSANASGNNPTMQGYEAIAHGTNPTAVAAADVTKGYANRAGIPFVIAGHPNVVTTEYLWTSAQTDDAIVSVGSGAKIVVTQLQVTVDEATTVGVGLRVGFGATTLPTAPTDGTAVVGYLASHRGLVPGSGLSRGDGSGILGVGADGEDLRITAEAPTSGSASLVVSFYTIES